LGYSLTKTIKDLYDINPYDLSKDSTVSKIQIEVLNGCGKSGVAEKLTDYLRAKGFDVVRLGNYRSFEIEKSIVISRKEKIQNAEKVASSVGLNNENVIQQINPEYLLDVTFILGKDYKQLIPIQKRLN
jgi:predicted GTPase